MAHEIERKFLVKNSDWKKNAKGNFFSQGYLSTDPEKTVRVRLEGNKATLTVKGLTTGISRPEFEFDIDFNQARQMLDTLCRNTCLTKIRYRIPYCGHTWEIDEFLGENTGLVVAELELQSEDEVFEKPQWLGEEISGDFRYYNSMLVSHPYSEWKLS